MQLLCLAISKALALEGFPDPKKSSPQAKNPRSFWQRIAGRVTSFRTDKSHAGRSL
jgi:hypothetical protein